MVEGRCNVGKKLTTLELKNIPPLHEPELTDFNVFAKVLASVRCLKLSYDGWVTVVSDLALDYPANGEPHTFTKELPRVLQKATSIEDLELRFKDYVGLFPKLDLRNLRYNSLNSLTLCKVVMWEHTVDGILGFGKTLQKLRLVDTPVMVQIRTFRELDDDNCPDYYSLAFDDVEAFAIGNRQWHKVFDKFRTGLPRLTKFEFMEDEQQSEVYLFPKRYGWYDSGIVFEVGPHEHERSLGVDAAALAHLHRKTGERKKTVALRRKYRRETGYEPYEEQHADEIGDADRGVVEQWEASGGDTSASGNGFDISDVPEWEFPQGEAAIENGDGPDASATGSHTDTDTATVGVPSEGLESAEKPRSRGNIFKTLKALVSK